MSLFNYSIALLGGKKKSGKITAKTEDLARERLAKANTIVEWYFIKPIPTNPASTPGVAQVSSVSAKKKSGTKLDRLLFLQSSKCFFCGRVLTKAEASIDHLQPVSKGGTNADDNMVACCVGTNRAFGSMGLKEKLRIVLTKKADFVCM